MKSDRAKFVSSLTLVTMVTDCEPNLLAGRFSLTNSEFLPVSSLLLSLMQLSDMGCHFLVLPNQC